MKFLTTAELYALPNPKWLVKGLLPDSGLNLLYGPPEMGKSFVALDWALCVSTGAAWLSEFPTTQGHVAYIAAEGGRGMRKRAAAWMEDNGFEELPNISWFLDSLDIDDEDVVDDFMNALESRFHPNFGLNVKLVVIDTLSRNFGGQDENASAAMTAFISLIEEFSKNHGAAVLIVHHTNAAGGRERGHSSLRGAMESSFECTATKANGTLDIMTLENNKQKDDSGGDPIYLKPRIHRIETLPPDEDGRALTSLVLRRCEKPEPEESEGKSGAWSSKVRATR